MRAFGRCSSGSRPRNGHGTPSGAVVVARLKKPARGNPTWLKSPLPRIPENATSLETSSEAICGCFLSVTVFRCTSNGRHAGSHSSARPPPATCDCSVLMHKRKGSRLKLFGSLAFPDSSSRTTLKLTNTRRSYSSFPPRTAARAHENDGFYSMSNISFLLTKRKCALSEIGFAV